MSRGISKSIALVIAVAIIAVIGVGLFAFLGLNDGDEPTGIIESDSGDTIVLREGQREGPLFVQEILPDEVIGLNFMEYPIARDEGFPVNLRIGDSVSNGCTITLTLLEIRGERALFLREEDRSRPCPIT